MRTYRFFAVFSIFFFQVISYSAQVDDYKIRYEQDYAQLKPQEYSLLPQKGYSFSQETNQQLHQNFSELLKQQTNFYLADHSIFHQDIYYQNRKVSPTLAIHNVDFSSAIAENNLQLLQQLHPSIFKQINAYQGYSASNNSSSAGQIALSTPIIPEKKDSHSLRVKSSLGLGNTNGQGVVQLALHRAKWSYLGSLYAHYQYNYPLGLTGSDVGRISWARLANPFNGAGAGSWALKVDSLNYTKPQVQLGLDNMFRLQMASNNELNFYLHIGGSLQENLGRIIQKNRDYLLSESSSDWSPNILAFIQKINYSESSPLYTQLNLAFTFQHLNHRKTERYDIQDELIRQHYEENKFSLQVRGYKNLDARRIFFYGAEASILWIKNNFHNTPQHTSFFSLPVTQFSAYFRKELRQSADISWLFGLKGGLENYAFSHAPYTVQTSYQVRPRAEFSLTWMRHICENSNYTINVFVRMKQPQMQEVNPLYGNTFLKPNAELKAEKEILIESHLYRKFDDKLEVHFTPYYRYSLDAILLRDYVDYFSERITIGLNNYFTQTFDNASKLSEGGAQLELRYNISKKILVYQQLNMHHIFSSLDTNLDYQSLPFYGNLGLKYKSNKILFHTWAHFNTGRNFSTSQASQYIRYYASQQNGTNEFPLYYLINFAVDYSLTKQLNLRFHLDNLLDRNYLSYLSTVPGMGRNYRLQISLTL